MTDPVFIDGIWVSAARPRAPNSLVPIIEALPHEIRQALSKVPLLADGGLRVETRHAHSAMHVALAVSATLMKLRGRHGPLRVGLGHHVLHVPAVDPPPTTASSPEMAPAGD